VPDGSRVSVTSFVRRLVDGNKRSAFFVKEYFPVASSGGNQCKNRHDPFGTLANHKIKMCHNSIKK